MASDPDIFSNAWATVLVLLFFGGSIFIHELGHFLAAKLRGLKVLRFSVGFGPILLSRRGKDGCEYVLSALPLGGYVAIPQLADLGALEGTDGSEAKTLPRASCLDKIIVSAAGAFFNVLLAAVLAVFVWIFGVPSNDFETTTVIGYVSKTITGADGKTVESPARKAGLLPGDKILSVDGSKVSDFLQIMEKIAIGSGRTESGAPKAVLEVERGGKVFAADVFPELVKTNAASGDEMRMIGVSPAMTMKISGLFPDSPAMEAGAKPGDIVESIDGRKLYSNMQLSDMLAEIPEGKTVDLGIIRGGKPVKLKIAPEKIALTKPLCKITLPDGAGSLSFISIPPKDPSSGAAETVKLLSVDTDDPRFAKISPGDILYQLALQRIESLSQLNALVNANVGIVGGRMHFSGARMDLKSAHLPASSTSEILPPKERMMLGYTLENVTVMRHPSVAEQFRDSVERTYSAIAGLANPQSDIGISSLAGPVDIGRVIYRLSLTDISLMLSFAVLLNINLAILNMLPIPVLDGGHIMFAIIEKIRGKPLPRSFFAAVQSAFSILFIALMGYVVYLGFLRWNGDSEYESAAEQSSQYYLRDISFKKHE